MDQHSLKNSRNNTMFLFGIVLLLGRRRRALRTLIREAPDSQESQSKSHLSQKFAPDRQKGSDKIRETTRCFCLALCFCWVGGVEWSELAYVRQESQNKSHLSPKFAPDRQKGSDKTRETTRLFGSLLCFCWVGGVERSELSYVRHLTVRRIKIKATCHKNLHLTGRNPRNNTLFWFGVVLLLGRRRRVVRTLISKAPDSQEGQNKSHLSQKRFHL